jgi:hypothetical protein
MLADADIRLSAVYSLTAFIWLHALLGAAQWSHTALD